MPELGEALSPREIDVLECIVAGETNKEIAVTLTISENTVKVHLRRIYAKLGVSSRTEAATAAIQQGLVAVPGVAPATPEPEPAAVADATPSEPDTQAGIASPPEQGETAPTALDVAFANSAAAQPPVPTNSAAPRTWRLVSIVLAAVLLLVVAGLVGRQFLGLAAPEETAVPTPAFSETPIGDSRWSLSRPLSLGRSGMAVTSVGLEIYSIGGETDTAPVGQVDIYDTQTYTWRRGADKPTAVANATAAVLFGVIYVPGGRQADGTPTNVVEVYSPANNAWRSVTALPQPLAGSITLTQGGLLYVIGGWNGTDYLNVAYEYNPAIDNWRPLPLMPTGRAYVTGGAIGGRLYIVGGYDGVEELTVCEYYDPISRLWEACPDMLAPRAGAGATVLLNHLYVIGGGLTAANEVTFGEEFSPELETWHVVNMPMLEAEPGWPNVGVTNVEARVYALGGRLEGTITANNYVFQAIFQTFIPAVPIP